MCVALGFRSLVFMFIEELSQCYPSGSFELFIKKQRALCRSNKAGAGKPNFLCCPSQTSEEVTAKTQAFLLNNDFPNFTKSWKSDTQ